MALQLAREIYQVVIGLELRTFHVVMALELALATCQALELEKCLVVMALELALGHGKW